MSSADEDIDAYELIEGTWPPYDGPYSPERTGEAATMHDRLVRYLNNATGKDSALPDVQTVSRVLSGLNAGRWGYDQLERVLVGKAEGQLAAGLVDAAKD